MLFGLSPLMILTTVYIIYYKKIVSKFYITLFLLAITLNISAGIKIIFKFIFSRNNVNHFLKTQNDDFKWLQDFHSLSAFPSGHTIITVSFFTILWLIYPRYKLIYIFTSLLIILSLVFLKFHFISDISSAVFAGCLISYFVYFSFKFFAKKEYAQLI